PNSAGARRVRTLRERVATPRPDPGARQSRPRAGGGANGRRPQGRRGRHRADPARAPQGARAGRGHALLGPRPVVRSHPSRGHRPRRERRREARHRARRDDAGLPAAQPGPPCRARVRSCRAGRGQLSPVPRDYYEILGVPRTAGEAEIKKAYRQLAMQFHPDRNRGDKGAEERFKEVNEAYAVLSDPDKRAHFDRFGTAPGVGQNFGDTGFGSLFEDIFDNFFSGGARGRGSRGARGEELQYGLKITLADAASGSEPQIQIPLLETWAAGSGSGVEPGSRLDTCDMCRGAGEVRRNHGFLTVAQTCPKCRGAGQLNRSPCKECRGEGRRRAERLLSVK